MVRCGGGGAGGRGGGGSEAGLRQREECHHAGRRPDAMLDAVEPPFVGARIQRGLRVRGAEVRWAGVRGAGVRGGRREVGRREGGRREVALGG